MLKKRRQDFWRRKGQVESAVADAKKALEGTDAAAMNAAREKLTAASHKLAEAIVQAQQTPPATALRAQARRQAPRMAPQASKKRKMKA